MTSSGKVQRIIKPDIVTVIEREGVRLRKKGRNFWALCPFHKESRPSFNVSAEKQVFNCFGCQAGGNVIKFIMDFKGFSYLQALQYLGIRKHEIEPINYTKSREQELIRRFRQWERNYYTELIEKYHAMIALKKRIVTPEDLDAVAWIFNEIPKTDYRLDILFSGDDEDKFNLFKEIKKHVI